MQRFHAAVSNVTFEHWLKSNSRMDLIEIINFLEAQGIPSWMTDTRISVVFVVGIILKPEASIEFPLFTSLDSAEYCHQISSILMD